MFCRHVLHNGTIDDLLAADYTFVNPMMAEFYGIPFTPDLRSKNDRGKSEWKRNAEDNWLKVSMPPHRRGILTQAASLSLTSNPTRTSAVKRGKWILETILGDPPPSAPPNVPSLDTGTRQDSASLRERLDAHRSNPNCAGCHKLMDPIGLGLENFDAIGRWRDQVDGVKIDPRGELADGKKFSGPDELLELLATRKEDFSKNFVEKLFTYALGRGLQRVDRCDVDKILEQAKGSRYEIKSMIAAIVQTDAFLQRSKYTSKPFPSQN